MRHRRDGGGGDRRGVGGAGRAQGKAGSWGRGGGSSCASDDASDGAARLSALAPGRVGRGAGAPGARGAKKERPVGRVRRRKGAGRGAPKTSAPGAGRGARGAKQERPPGAARGAGQRPLSAPANPGPWDSDARGRPAVRPPTAAADRRLRNRGLGNAMGLRVLSTRRPSSPRAPPPERRRPSAVMSAVRFSPSLSRFPPSQLIAGPNPRLSSLSCSIMIYMCTSHRLCETLTDSRIHQGKALACVCVCVRVLACVCCT